MSILRPSGSQGKKTRRDPGATQLEIQYHPSDIRKGVRYLFLTRRQVAGYTLGALAYVTFLGMTAWLLPQEISEEFARVRFEDAKAERNALGDRLETNLARLESVHGETDAVGVEIGKIYLAYGFTKDESQGQGGYPYQAEAVPESIFVEEIRRGNGLTARIEEQAAVLETFIDEVQAFEAEYANRVRTTPSISPVRSADFVLTSPFGNRTSPFTKKLDFHAGVDLAAKIGTPVYAPADAVVAFAGRYPLRQNAGWWRYGNMVTLRQGDLFISLYGHLDEVKVRGGQKIEQGTEIGTIGNTGWSTSPHLHYEVRRKEVDKPGQYTPIDPRIYMLDHTWRGEERMLIRAREAPDASSFDPLPKILR
ncbi:MAG: M23 family metallopeptidase [Acidobacteriota bacterium]